MSVYGNMDKSLIRKNPIAAISMEHDDMLMVLRKGLGRFITEEMLESEEPVNLSELLSIALCDRRGAPPFDQVYQDIQAAVKVDPLAVEISYDALRQKIPVIQINLMGEEQAMVAVLVYWDGKAFRGYVPMYGNGINPFLNCAYGLEGDADPHLYLDKTYTVQGDGRFASLFKRGEDFLPQDETVQITLTRDNYPKVEWMLFVPNVDACADDFCANVTYSKHLSSVEAWELSGTV